MVVSQLSGQFGVSEETIRRDLEKLETEGFATKSYGGAVLREDGAADAPFGIRKKEKCGPEAGNCPSGISAGAGWRPDHAGCQQHGHLYCPGAERGKNVSR